MNKQFQIILFLVLSLAGCAAETDYLSYEDRMNKGEKAFLKDLKACRSFSIENTRKSEGSEGAGELQNRKNSLHLFCMQENGWVLKK